MDFVVVTHAPDVKLLRHFLESYDLYYSTKDRLHIFTSVRDQALLDQVKLPSNASLVYREDFPAVAEATPFSQQLYLKLMSHTVVTTDYFCIMDSDFLFIRPTSDADLFYKGKPVWYYRTWIDGEPPLRWRAGSEAFLGSNINHLYAWIPQFVFHRSVALELTKRYDPRRILNDDTISEFLVYGWFAHRYYPDAHFFARDLDVAPPVVRTVNQIPPDYCHLDPSVSYQQFRGHHCVAFWSHWDLAESKMVEFFEDSQREHFGRVQVPGNSEPLYTTTDPEAINSGEYGDIDGSFADGWVKDVLHLSLDVPDDALSVEIDLDVPSNPIDHSWSLAVSASFQQPSDESIALVLEP